MSRLISAWASQFVIMAGVGVMITLAVWAGSWSVDIARMHREAKQTVGPRTTTGPTLEQAIERMGQPASEGMEIN